MSAEKINGLAVRDKILANCKEVADDLIGQAIRPGLAVVIVGEDPPSLAYVRSKVRTCEKLGYHSVKHELPTDTTQEALLALVSTLNLDSKIHGILVQSPLPTHIDEAAIVQAIDPAKDVDGFHPVNVAKLTLDDPSGFVACTPLGCLRLLKESGIDTSGANAVIVGRSMIVGKPLALLLMRRGNGGDATVTVAHSRTRDLPAVCRTADILIAALGRPASIGADHIRPGAVIIDVGINRVEDRSVEKGYRLVGDVDAAAAESAASAMTPVPGGVGPMTIAMLMRNTLQACLRANHLDDRIVQDL